ncbi:hypothetical protein [Halobaculum lipolyticum]|uniref:Uncharacterized protein n=1 Tax=Halobaculum lipolyticum TaxID=3032001 RepID=A0ABD5WC99_9EURY|nr:hypothetical protein [Halobaculum sp. DT31]
MGVRETRAGDPDRAAQTVETPETGPRGLWSRVRERLADWSRVHARMQVELLAGQPRDR